MGSGQLLQVPVRSSQDMTALLVNDDVNSKRVKEDIKVSSFTLSDSGGTAKVRIIYSDFFDFR